MKSGVITGRFMRVETRVGRHFGVDGVSLMFASAGRRFSLLMRSLLIVIVNGLKEVCSMLNNILAASKSVSGLGTESFIFNRLDWKCKLNWMIESFLSSYLYLKKNLIFHNAMSHNHAYILLHFTSTLNQEFGAERPIFSRSGAIKMWSFTFEFHITTPT